MANLFIPFEVRTVLEGKRQELERRVHGYGQMNPADAVAFINKDLLDIVEILDLILKTVGIQDQRP